MSTSQVPAVIDALVAGLTTALAGQPVRVVDGLGLSGDTGDFILVGVDDPFTDSPVSASADQGVATMGTPRSRNENGVVTCVAYSWNGDADQKVARDTAFGYLAATETLLRDTPSLGITAVDLMVAQIGTAQRLSQGQTESGADALLVFDVIFRARI